MAYHVIDLEGLTQGFVNRAYGINDQHSSGTWETWPPVPSEPKPFPVGQVVGVSPGPATNPTWDLRAFRWDEDAGLTDVGNQSPGVDTWAYAINDAGTAVGWWETSGAQSQALMWNENLEITALAPLLSGNTVSSHAYDINDQGVVVGRARPDGSDKYRGFVFDSTDNSVIWIQPGKNPAHQTFAYAVNKNRQVVGQIGTGTGTQVDWGPLKAFHWSENAGLERLFNDDTLSTASDINDSGVIVGVFLLNPQGPGAFIRQPDGSLIFPGTGFGADGEAFSANAINNQDEVVGTGLRPAWFDGQEPDAYEYAWIFDRYRYSGDAAGAQSGSYEDLNTLIPLDSGWQLIEAWDINNAGQIVGWGRRDGAPRPFLLIPKFVRNLRFDLYAELSGRLLGGVAKDGGGIIIKPGGGGPVPPWDPIRDILTSSTRDAAVEAAIRLAIDLTDDEALRQALREVSAKTAR